MESFRNQEAVRIGQYTIKSSRLVADDRILRGNHGFNALITKAHFLAVYIRCSYSLIVFIMK